MEQHFHLLGLLERNERLFHRVLCEHYEELLPVMYAPTVGQVCKKFSVMFNRPRGLYITCKDRGEIHRILKNWPEKRVKLVVVTDGERVMGLGDLGVQGMGVAAAKTNLYTAAGGLDPSDVLAVCLDVGTNNRELLNDPLYIGNKHERTVGEAYDELLDEFVDAVKRRFGERCVIQFEDFSNANGKRLLERYASRAAVFNDDIHGVAATALAGIIAARPKTGKGVSEHTYLIAGAGETGTGIGEMIAEYAAAETGRTVAETRRLVWMVDSKGLVTRHRAESEPDLALHKLPFAHPGDQGECLTVLEAVEAVKPTALIGVRRHKHSLRVGALATTDGGAYEGYAEDPAGGVAGVADRGARDSGAPPPRLFTDEVLRAMRGPHAPAPLIFALSRPEGIAECDARHAYEATEGACAFAAGCPNEPFVDRHTGKESRSGRARPRTSSQAWGWGWRWRRRRGCGRRCSTPPPRRWRTSSPRRISRRGRCTRASRGRGRWPRTPPRGSRRSVTRWGTPRGGRRRGEEDDAPEARRVRQEQDVGPELPVVHVTERRGRPESGGDPSRRRRRERDVYRGR